MKTKSRIYAVQSIEGFILLHIFNYKVREEIKGARPHFDVVCSYTKRTLLAKIREAVFTVHRK